MVAVRDEAVMAARRRDKQAAAEASNDFYPAGFDKAAEMRASDFLTVIHRAGHRYAATEAPPPGVDALPRMRNVRAAVAAVGGAERRELEWLCERGYPANLVFLFYRTPQLRFELLAALRDAKPERTKTAGTAALLRAQSDAGWHDREELLRLVAMMARTQPALDGFSADGRSSPNAVGRERVAKVFMQVCTKTGFFPEGTLRLWINFVDCRCLGEPWIGEPFGWNPARLALDDLARAYGALRELQDDQLARYRTAETWPAAAPEPVAEEPRPKKRRMQGGGGDDAGEDAAEPAAGAGAQLQGGRVKPWGQRRAEFLRLIADKYPDFVLSDDFDEDQWPQRVQTRDAVVHGTCGLCAAPMSGSVRHITGAQGLPKCGSETCRSQGRRSVAWGSRRAEFVRFVADKYPDFVLSGDFDEEHWPQRVQTRDAVVYGTCMVCAEDLRGSVHHITGAQGLPKCRSETCREARAPQMAAARATMLQARPQLPQRPRLNPQACSFDAAMEHMKTYYPTVKLAAHLMTRDGWYLNVGMKPQAQAYLEGSCTLCGLEKRVSAINILGAGQGFCRTCGMEERGLERVAHLYGDLVHVSDPHMAQENGKGQRVLHVHLQCLRVGCGWSGVISTRHHEYAARQFPDKPIVGCKRCTQVIPWKGQQGYENMRDCVMAFFADTRFYQLACTLEWWTENVENCNTKVPIRCTLCDAMCEVRISSVQQGGSVGCGCPRSVVRFEQELRSIMPGVTLRKEASFLSTKRFDFALFYDEDYAKNRAEYEAICQLFGVVPHLQVPRIAFELDGPQHFTLLFDGIYKPMAGILDLEKELLGCQRGYTIIRMEQQSIWDMHPAWPDFLRGAIALALREPGGRVLCEDTPHYTTEGSYVRLHEDTPLAEVARRGDFEGGVIREAVITGDEAAQIIRELVAHELVG